MSKKQTQTPEPELSPMASRVTLLTLSLCGAGLPETLKSMAGRLADQGVIDVDRYTGDITEVKTDDLSVMLGDRASMVRAILDDPGVLTETEAAAAMGPLIGPEVVVGLCQRRGVPTTAGENGALVHKRLWGNLVRLLSAEAYEFDGHMRDYDGVDWLLRHLGVTQALKNATPGFVWEDPFYKPVVPRPRVLRAFEAAMQAVQGPPRPMREPTVRFDEDEEYRHIADRIGVRHSTTAGEKLRAHRTAFLGWDLFRLTGLLPSDPAAPGRERTREQAYEKLTRDSYTSVFPDALNAILRAELQARFRKPELITSV